MKLLSSVLLATCCFDATSATTEKCCEKVDITSENDGFKTTCKRKCGLNGIGVEECRYQCDGRDNFRVSDGSFKRYEAGNDIPRYYVWEFGGKKESDHCWYEVYDTKGTIKESTRNGDLTTDFKIKCSTDDGGTGAGGSGAGSAACLSGWGTDIANCYPEDAVLECSSTGFKLSGLTKSIMYESSNALKSGHAYGILANGESVGTFDDNGDVTIEKTWNDISDLTVTHATDSIKFEVEISAEDPAVKVGDVTIHTTRTESFKITCSYSDKVKISLDDGPIDVNVGNELGTSGSIDKTEDGWSSSFNLDVYSEDTFITKITATEPITLGSPVYGKILATNLPTALQYFVSNCEAKASSEETETTKMPIFNNYECFNPIFGDSESIFMGRSIKTGSTSDYKFSFPAFTFNVVENDQLHITCEITICPADSDCIESSYSAQRALDNDSCNTASAGFKSNTVSDTASDEKICCQVFNLIYDNYQYDQNCEYSGESNDFSSYQCGDRSTGLPNDEFRFVMEDGKYTWYFMDIAFAEEKWTSGKRETTDRCWYENDMDNLVMVSKSSGMPSTIEISCLQLEG